MKELYQAGALGKFEYGEGEYMHNCEDIWHNITFGDPDHWRNTMHACYYCTHSIGPIIHMTGLRPVSVVGFEGRKTERNMRMGAKAGQFGIEMITIPMTMDGPDMDLVEKYVNHDETVKGIWCVPKYSNPQGVVYSDETVKRIAALKPAAKDFRVFWDNAYCIHDLYDEVPLLEIFAECKKNGNDNMVYEFCSTSKVSFAGAGISALATSDENLESIKKYMTIQTIGYDKINQLRHVRYFKNVDGVKAHMKKHADLLRPKFEAVIDTFNQELKGLGIGSWLEPKGGYFISFESMPGCAKAIVAKCKEAGVVLTGAGATYPYGIDPNDSNIRIAPSFPTEEEMRQATELFVLCVKLVSVDKLLETK